MQGGHGERLGVEAIYALGWFTGEGLVVNAWGARDGGSSWY